MTIYLLAAIDRKDLETYGKYEQAGFESVAKYNVEALAVCDTPELIEGKMPAQRFVLLRFKDKAALDKWYKSPEYRSRIVREPRAVLGEFGLELEEGVEVRVWDSSSDMRYMVLPQRPRGTEQLPEEELAALVTRESMVGVARLRETR